MIMCDVCNEKELTVVELRNRIDYLEKEIEKLEHQNGMLSSENFRYERAILDLIKRYTS